MGAMSDRIEPALTPEEWRTAKLWLAGKMIGGKVRGSVVLDLPDKHTPAALALANAALPDTDPRKITREWVADIRERADDLAGEIAEWVGDSPRTEAQIARLRRIADALESYLPPETP